MLHPQVIRGALQLHLRQYKRQRIRPAALGRHLLQLKDEKVLEEASARLRSAELRRVHP